MKTAIVGGGSTLVHTPRTQDRRYKGYAKHRVDYDRRRRLSTRSAATIEFMGILAADPCAICGAPPSANSKRVSDRDHIVPLGAGGEDAWTNMTAACASCNRGRRDRDLLSFLLRRVQA